MPKFKGFKVIVMLCLVAFLFCGCNNFRLSSSIDDLISPISPSGDNAGVQSAVDEYCKGGYSIKIPATGKYTTSFILKDIDGDKISEAVAFYEPSNKIGTISMAVIKKSGDKWSVVSNIEGTATDVNCVDFFDFNNDGKMEIIVCWSVVSKLTGTSINVYSQNENNGAYSLQAVSKAITGSDFICVDVNDDGVKDLLVFATGTSSENPRAELYSFETGKRELIGETRLDSTITSYESIKYAKTDEGTSVYADALCGDGSSMVTEFIYWSDYYNSIISPFYSYSTGRTKSTVRSSLTTCRDIDGDGVIEIPKDASNKKQASEITTQNWVSYGNTVLSHKCYSLACKRDGYILVVGDDDFSKIKASYDSEKRKLELTNKNNNKKAIEIITLINSSYSENDPKYEDYSLVMKNSGFVYLAKVDSSSGIDINIKKLRDMIKVY